MVLGQEAISWLEVNEALHLEKCAPWDEFNKISNLVKPFLVLFGGVSCNMKSLHDQYVKLVERVAELEKISISMEMVVQTRWIRIGLVDKLAMLEHAIRKLKGNLMDSSSSK
ncbi:unnamed protein product [Lactuca saligna]|uniref:Uncharacterized protein n=1 Tax=Lactuca saligna TaxID=75948 RepID=A0AA35ZFJ2_LACSI|nr:unnamed protein product [Lactuca saligna]